MKFNPNKPLQSQLKTGFLFTLLLSMAFQSVGFSQEASPSESLTISLESYINPAGVRGDLPFWLHSQKYGVVDQTSANSFLMASYFRTLIDKERFEVAFEATPMIRVSSQSTAHFNRFYLDARYRGFKLTAGRFKDPLAEKEDLLSTGSFIMSRNATPIPKVAFYTDGFIPIPGLFGIVNFKAFYSHGWFENERYASNVYLHQKYFYLNIKYAFFDAIGGIVHNAQWGGSSSLGKYPQDINAYLEAVFGLSATSSNAPIGEQENAVGNSLAAYDFSLGLDFKPINIRLYRLFYLEDKVSTRFRSPWDGIWGGVFKPKKLPILHTFLYEHINTRRQDSFDFEPRGSASYYNHYLYRTGWTYEGRVLGNSLITTNGSIDKPIYNNIIIAHHLAAQGRLNPHVEYTAKYTFSRNYGIADDQIVQRYPNEGGSILAVLRPFSELRKLNHSLFLELSYTLPANNKYEVGVSLAADVGEFYKDRIGMGVRLAYAIF